MQANFDNAFASIKADPRWTPAWMAEIRAKAYEEFQTRGFPTRQDEDWKYTSTRPLTQETFDWTQLSPEVRDMSSFFVDGANTLVFLNGVYNASLSRMSNEKGLNVQPIADALSSLELDTKGRGSLDALNRAFLSSGAFISVTSSLSKPLQLLFVNSASEGSQLIAPRNVIKIAKEASATIFESHFSFLEANFTNSVNEITIEDGGRCVLLLEKILSSGSLHVSHSHIHLGRDAEIETFNLSLGGRINRTQLSFELTAPGARAKLDGLYVGKLSTHIDNITEVIHQAPHTSSSQVYKGILADSSRAVFNGKITIAKGAQQTEAHQLNKNLLLSREAEVDSRPQLKIDADDVRCSHGATIGQLDEQELFYLQSRGIPRQDAQQMLAKAFVSDVIGRSGQAAVRTRLSKLLREFGGMEA